MLMMLPFEAPTIFEGIHKSYFRMPRVVKDQRSRFENDDLFRQLSHESAVKYTGFKDRPLEERQMKFIANCQEGHTEVSVVQSGSQFTLMFNPTINPAYNHEGCDFDKELGKVHIKAGFILNGVCVLWHGWIDLQRLEGFGCVEFDEYRAYLEDAMVKQSIDKQQTCNSLANNQTSMGRLNPHLGAASLLPPQSFNPQVAASAVAAITTNSVLPPQPMSLNPACLAAAAAAASGGGGPGSMPPHQQQQQQPAPPPSAASGLGQMLPPQPPPASLADLAAQHHGNAALAAAAAAAFHQALSIGGGGPQPPGGPQPSHPALGFAGVPPSSGMASGSHHPLIPYTNGTNIIPTTQTSSSSPLAGLHLHHNTSPQHHRFLNDTQTSNTTTATGAHGNSPASMQHNHQTKSPERENNHQHHPSLNTNYSSSNNSASRRQATKRAPEELAQNDDVDVVSDIDVHELDFPPRRIFKSDSLTTSHMSQKVARRAAS